METRTLPSTTNLFTAAINAAMTAVLVAIAMAILVTLWSSPFMMHMGGWLFLALYVGIPSQMVSHFLKGEPKELRDATISLLWWGLGGGFLAGLGILFVLLTQTALPLGWPMWASVTAAMAFLAYFFATAMIQPRINVARIEADMMRPAFERELECLLPHTGYPYAIHCLFERGVLPHDYWETTECADIAQVVCYAELNSKVEHVAVQALVERCQTVSDCQEALDSIHELYAEERAVIQARMMKLLNEVLVKGPE